MIGNKALVNKVMERIFKIYQVIVHSTENNRCSMKFIIYILKLKSINTRYKLMKNYLLLILFALFIDFQPLQAKDNHFLTVKTANFASVLKPHSDASAAIQENDIYFSEMYDKTEFDDRYNDLKHHFYLPLGFKSGEIKWSLYLEKYHLKDSIGEITEFSHDSIGAYINCDKNLVKFKLENHKENRKNGKSFFTFNIYNSNYDYTKLIGLFPELIAFKNYKFELTEFISSREFNKTYKKKMKYNDVRILYEKGDKEGTIELKTMNEFIQISFKVIRTNARGRDKIDTRFIRFFNKYQIYLNRKRYAFNAYVTSTWKGTKVDKDARFYRIKKLVFKRINLGLQDQRTWEKQPLEFNTISDIYSLADRINDIKFRDDMDVSTQIIHEGGLIVFIDEFGYIGNAGIRLNHRKRLLHDLHDG